MTEKIFIGIDDKRIEATGDVLEKILKDRADYEKALQVAEAEKSAKAEAKAALLERLGITAEEAVLLLG